jgi:hypothetical protein
MYDLGDNRCFPAIMEDQRLVATRIGARAGLGEQRLDRRKRFLRATGGG